MKHPPQPGLNKHGIPIARPKPAFCDKAQYPSETAARIAAMTRPLSLRQYYCASCAAWHNTKQIS